jgi:hypothetical protein
VEESSGGVARERADGRRVRVERGADAATVAMVLAALGVGGRR